MLEKHVAKQADHTLQKLGEHFGETQTKVIKAESTRYKSLVERFRTDWKTDIEGWFASNMNARWQVLQFEKNELSKSATVLNSMMKKVKDKVDERKESTDARLGDQSSGTEQGHCEVEIERR